VAGVVLLTEEASTMNERQAKWVVLGTGSGEPMSAETAVAVLNELFALDPDGTRRLVDARVPCNRGVADHPTVICGPTGDGFEVGLIGVLNGILGREDPCGSGVATLTDRETGELLGFTPINLREQLSQPV